MRSFVVAVVGAVMVIPAAASAATVEQKVRAYFIDAPVMAEIARCESKFRQYTDSGAPLRGGWGEGMIGVFQFNEAVHGPSAGVLGYDLETLEGNMAYARHMYVTQGTKPWNSSKSCWDIPTLASDASTSVVGASMTTEKRTLLLKQIEVLTKLITLLQKQLDAQVALQR